MSSAVYSFITFQSPASWESLLILGLLFCFPPLLLTSETSYEKLDHPAPTSTRWPTLLLGSWSLLKDTGGNSRQLCSDPASPSQSFNLIHSCYWLVQSRIPSIPPDSTRNLLWNQNHRHVFFKHAFLPQSKTQFKWDHQCYKVYRKCRGRQTGQQGDAHCFPHLNSILQHATEAGLVDTDSSSPTHLPGQTTQSGEEDNYLQELVPSWAGNWL